MLTLSIVIEPSIRMSWIEDNWGTEYVTKGKKLILDTVRVRVEPPR